MNATLGVLCHVYHIALSTMTRHQVVSHEITPHHRYSTYHGGRTYNYGFNANLQRSQPGCYNCLTSTSMLNVSCTQMQRCQVLKFVVICCRSAMIEEDRAIFPMCHVWSKLQSSCCSPIKAGLPVALPKSKLALRLACPVENGACYLMP